MTKPIFSKFYLINEGLFLFWMPITQLLVIPFSCCCLTMIIPVLMNKILEEDDDDYAHYVNTTY